jgi:hypothetical protein
MAKELDKAEQAQLDLAIRAIRDGEALPVASDPEAVSRAIVERILSAESFDEAFKPQQLAAWRDYLEMPVYVRGFHLNPTALESSEGRTSPSVYAIVDIEPVDERNGAAMTVTCGGRNVLTQLVMMLQHKGDGWMDKPVKMTSRQTSDNFQALWLVAA